MRLLKHRKLGIYVDGMDLLRLCEKLAKETPNIRPAGEGTAEEPFRMSNASHYSFLYNRTNTNESEYYVIAGRQIISGGGNYVSDIGPAYLHGTGVDDATKKARDKYTTTYGAIKATTASNTVQNWKQNNTSYKKTYMNLAENIAKPETIYNGACFTSSWARVEKTPQIAKDVRALIRDERLAFFTGKTAPTTQAALYDANYSRKLKILPLLSACIFIAEPSRNIRAWPINLMLLDLAQSGRSPSWEAILWHPGQLFRTSKPAVQGNFGWGPKGKAKDQREVKQHTSSSDLHLIGGFMPASPTGGSDWGKHELLKDDLKYSKAKTTPTKMDYIHQKEIDVLMLWLMQIGFIHANWEVENHGTIELEIDQKCVALQDIIYPNDTMSKNIALPFHEFLRRRITSLDFLL